MKCHMYKSRKKVKIEMKKCCLVQFSLIYASSCHRPNTLLKHREHATFENTKLFQMQFSNNDNI